MPNFTNVKTIIECGRNAGVMHPNNDKLRVGGRYHPAYTKANGQQVAARWTGQIAINHRPYKDGQGNNVKVESDYLRLTVWSAKGNPNGLAESYARSMCIGMELIVHCEIKPFKSDIYDNNQKIVRADGNAIQVEKIGFTVIPGSTMFLGESGKRIDTEVKSGLRPADWNVQGSQGQATWNAMIAEKNAEQYTPGKEMFGYAVVVADKGAQANAYMGTGLSQPTAPLVEGHTYEAWKAANPTLTDDIMLANPKFQAFAALIQSKKVAGAAAPSYQAPAAPPAQGAFQQAY
jgi:hypothetical protein